MRLIQAKVSDEQFKAFSHYLVEEDITVGEAVVGWIEEHCGGGHKLTRTIQVKPRVIESIPTEKPLPGPIAAQREAVSGFVCKVCGKPTKGEFLCVTCKKL